MPLTSSFKQLYNDQALSKTSRSLLVTDIFDVYSENYKKRSDRLKCDGTRAETRFRLSEKRTNPFKTAGASVQSTTGSRGVRISGSNAAYNMFRGGVKGTGYPLHSSVSPSPLPPARASPCAITFQLEANNVIYRQNAVFFNICATCSKHRPFEGGPSK